ncbi:MAG: 2-oxo acid dehydrogenase subunit E2 [Solirubrobacteraceae bacterium]
MSSTESVPDAADPAPLKGQTTIVEPSRVERSIARRTAEVRATVPDLELSADVDATGLLAATAGGCAPTAVLVRACAQALRSHPRANAAYRDGHYELYSRVNVAVTVFTEDGWLSPTLIDADTRTLEALDAELIGLSARAAAGELTPPELAGATFTLTDLGPWRVSRPSAFVAAPQAAALAAGAVQSVAVVRDGAVVPGDRVTLTLACDSRILFGVHAARFLGAVADALEAGAPGQPSA